MLPFVTNPAKAATTLVGAALLVGLVYEIGFNTSDAFVGIVVLAFLTLAAGMVAIIWLVDMALVRTLMERRRSRLAKPS